MIETQSSVNYCDVQIFVKKHREMDIAYYGKPYDDQDKYQLTLTGVVEDIKRFVSEMESDRIRPYIRFPKALVEANLQKIKQLNPTRIHTYTFTIYHVGSCLGQERELTEWLKWIENKKVEYPELKIEMRFSHISNSDIFVLSL